MHDYKNLIYLGAGQRPALSELTELAEQLWLVDASAEVIEQLEAQVDDHPNVRVIQALVDSEQRPGIFYEYNLAWANGLKPLDEAIQRLYPGLFCIGSQQQMTTGISELVRECLELDASGTHAPAENLLIIDLSDQAYPLLNSLHDSSQLLNFSNVAIVPPHRSAIPFCVPPSLYRLLESPSAIPAGLPENSQFFSRHPLAQSHQQLQRELQQIEQQLSERTQERDAKVNELEHVKQTLDQIQQQLSGVAKERDELAQELEVAKRQANGDQQQLQKEQAYRQQLIDQELLKAETQLDLIKDILISDKAL